MPPTDASTDTDAGPNSGPDCEETLDLRLPRELLALRVREQPDLSALPPDDDLLDHVADWGATTTSAGVFQLLPVHLGRDLPLIARWMNDPAVAAFWELAGDASVTERHLRAQLAGDGRSMPCLGVLDGTPMSYWEIYRADLDPLARSYPARPHDTGIHLLIGGAHRLGRHLCAESASERLRQHGPSAGAAAHFAQGVHGCPSGGGTAPGTRQF